MTQSNPEYEQAEQALLASEGIAATAQQVHLERLGGTLRVVIAGSGPPVLFVPGVMTTGVVFAGLVGRLPNYRCIMIDRPGTGLSPLLPTLPKDLSEQQRVADTLLVDILDGLDIEQSHVVSTSLGGYTTFRSLANNPERFLRVSALGYQIGARITSAPLSMRMSAPTWMMPKRVPASRALVKAMLKPAGMRNAIETGKFSDHMLDYMVALLRHTDTFGNESRFNQRPFNLRGEVAAVRHTPELLTKVTMPVHLFWGTDDVFGGEESARELAELLPHAQLQMVDGAGHAPWLDEPEMAADAVRGHLGQ